MSKKAKLILAVVLLIAAGVLIYLQLGDTSRKVRPGEAIPPDNAAAQAPAPAPNAPPPIVGGPRMKK